MPLSIWLGMEDALAAIVEQNPSSVLDAGIGFGLWGALLRQYLDVWNARIQPWQWTTRIDGIEIDENRIQAHARALYTEILIGDIRCVVPQRAAEQPYDVVLFGDVIEHLPKPDGHALLETTARLTRKLVVVRIPLGDGWRRKGREEPDHHRSQWYPVDFDRYPSVVRQYDFYGNPYGIITIDGNREFGSDLTGALADMESRLNHIENRIERLIGQ